VILGILSDTHGRLESTIAGIDALRQAGAEFYIHCGDVGSEAILDQLAGLRAAIIWGNNDWDTRSLGSYAQALGITVMPALGEIELAGKRIAVTHGDNAGLIRKVLDDQRHDYLLLGHTHVRADKKMGRVRVINPGALHRAAQKSVALLDLERDDLKFLMI
jgi:putative phosphoesterase